MRFNRPSEHKKLRHERSRNWFVRRRFQRGALFAYLAEMRCRTFG